MTFSNGPIFECRSSRLNQAFQKHIIAGRQIDTNLSKVQEHLNLVNQTLFGNLAGDFTMDANGKIYVTDYGAQVSFRSRNIMITKTYILQLLTV